MNDPDAIFTKLIALLDEVKAKGWPECLPVEIAALLKKAWLYLEDDDTTSFHAGKLSADRIESPVWDPPLFKFSIKRHGATVFGSTRAEVHDWVFDLEKKTATFVNSRRRQLYKMEPRYYPAKDCQEVLSLITSDTNHPWLKWSSDRLKVTVNIGLVVPSGGYKQTEAGRRRRFRKILAEMLKDHGWDNEGGFNSYVKRK